MARQNPTRRLIGKIVFIILVVASGVALAASGNMSNPFEVVSRIGSMAGVGGMGTSPERGEPGGARPGGAGNGMPSEGAFERDNHGGGGGSEAETTFQWSSFGGVAFNLWFIAAATAFVIVIGQPVGYLFKLLRRKTNPVPARA